MAVDPNVFAQHVTKVAKERGIDITGEQIAELFPNIYEGLGRCGWCGAFVDHYTCYQSTGVACQPHNDHHQYDCDYEHGLPSVQREESEVINSIRNCQMSIGYVLDGHFYEINREQANQISRSMGLSLRMLRDE